jgi:DNA-directed RNA polymerase specialized sigma24 family protein
MPPYKRFCLSQYFQGKTQTEIAKMLAISQPSVQAIIQRGIFRCLELSQLPPRPSEAMAKKAFHLLPEKTRLIMLLMFRHEVQSEAADKLGRTQGYVRYWYLKGLDDMKVGRVQDWMRKVKELNHFERSQFFVGRLPFNIPSGKALLTLAEQVLQNPS